MQGSQFNFFIFGLLQLLTSSLLIKIYSTYIILHKEYQLHSFTNICIYMSVQWVCNECVLGCVLWGAIILSSIRHTEETKSANCTR